MAETPEDRDNFGFTRAERIEQFTVPGWTPDTPYYTERPPGPKRSWVVRSPNGHAMDFCATRDEAQTFCRDRNSGALWAYLGGQGETIRGTDIRFYVMADLTPRLPVWDELF